MTVVLSYGGISPYPTSKLLPERKKCWLLVMGDSLFLREQKGPYTNCSHLVGDVCCLPEAQVKDVKIMKINLPIPDAALRLLFIADVPAGQQ